jgi:predicted phosphoribosyltransferase
MTAQEELDLLVAAAEQKRLEYEEMMTMYGQALLAFSWLSSTAAAGRGIEIGITERGNVALVVQDDGGTFGATGASLQAAVMAYRQGHTQNVMMGDLEEPDDQ